MSEADDARDDEEARPGPRGARRRIWIAAGVVAVAVAAVLVMWLWPRGGDSTAGGIPPSRDPRAIRVAPTALIRPGQTLRWSKTPAAARYAIEVFSADGTPSWRAESAVPELVWPTGGAATVPGRYRYKIVALSTDRNQLAASALLQIEVVP